ncbi:hypothetical protein SDC9_113855 [bioreactor metagenome]|uniref:Uncharacterized protein n=1 Tax=bioreactor metagenome TaxID=1076179 RepID=A0A645BQR9_9ZZZZ
MALLDEGETTCCYARSDKHWITDPQGIAWEHFHSLGNIPVFSEAPDAAAAAKSAAPAAPAACCPPVAKTIESPKAAACCTPRTGGAKSCC